MNIDRSESEAQKIDPGIPQTLKGRGHQRDLQMKMKPLSKHGTLNQDKIINWVLKQTLEMLIIVSLKPCKYIL